MRKVHKDVRSRYSQSQSEEEQAVTHGVATAQSVTKYNIIVYRDECTATPKDYHTSRYVFSVA